MVDYYSLSVCLNLCLCYLQSSGLKKIKLIPEFDVWLTPSQLSTCLHRANGNPRKLIANFLDTFFSRETLAQSSAKGSRSAHNSNMKTAALNTFVIQAIVQYVLKSFKKPDGEPILRDSDINDTINSKCATARRSLNPPTK